MSITSTKLLTLPSALAAGCEGSYRSGRSDLSRPISFTRTVSTSRPRSSAEPNVTVFRRYASAPGVEPVVSWLARFSAMTRSRVPCASMARAEIASALLRSMPPLLLALPERRAEEAHVFRVEVGHEFLVRFCVGDFHQLVVEPD